PPSTSSKSPSPPPTAPLQPWSPAPWPLPNNSSSTKPQRCLCRRVRLAGTPLPRQPDHRCEDNHHFGAQLPCRSLPQLRKGVRSKRHSHVTCLDRMSLRWATRAFTTCADASCHYPIV